MFAAFNGAEPDGQPLQESLAEIAKASQVPARRREVDIGPTVETLTSQCYEKGLLPEELLELVDLIITPTYLNQATLNSLLRNLYPATAIDGDLVIKIISCLGHGALKPSLPVQAGLLKWLIMIHHLVKEQDALAKSYAVLFNLLDTAAIRPQLCHLLALITRRRHVRPYRIQSLLALSRQTGSDPALVGLLRVFKNYYPEIIVGDATRGKASAFKHPDVEWRERLNEIQKAHAQSLRDQNQPRDGFRVARQFGHAGSRTSASVVPEVHTSHAQENSVTLEEIESVEGLVNNLEKIELPNQLISVLADPLLQKLMLLKPDVDADERISNWLVSFTEDMMHNEATSLADLPGFLEILHDYASTIKDLPPAVMSFFISYLQIWDGKQSRQTMLHILSHTTVPEGSFTDIYKQIFSVLEAKLLDGTVQSQLDLLKCYTDLLRNWVTALVSRDTGPKPANAAIPDLIRHVNKLCLTVVQTSSSASTHSMVLDFYELCAYAVSNPKLNRRVRIVLPPPALVYVLHFSSSPATVSRLCGVLARYKEGFQAVMVTSRSDYSTVYINEFNGFLMDICNCLWRSRAFNNKDANSHGCLIPEAIAVDLASYVSAQRIGSNLVSLFTLSASPALGLLATSYLRELEDIELEQGSGGLDTRHAGPITKASLIALGKNGGVSLSWDEFRLGLLGYLEQNGMEGVGRLMHATMTTLVKRG